MHVNLDRARHRVTDVVVGGLAGQDGVQVRPLEVLNQDGVDRLVAVLVVVAAVNESVFPPPVQLRWRSPCRHFRILVVPSCWRNREKRRKLTIC